MPTIILDEQWKLSSSGVTKQPGTQLVFARGAGEAQDILDAGAGHLLGSGQDDPADAEASPREVKSERLKDKMQQQTPTPLPENFPGRTHLEEAGYVTLQQVAEASPEELGEVSGIGEHTLQKIQQAL